MTRNEGRGLAVIVSDPKGDHGHVGGAQSYAELEERAKRRGREREGESEKVGSEVIGRSEGEGVSS